MNKCSVPGCNNMNETTAEIERLRDELAAIAKIVLSTDIAYPNGCNLNTPGRLIELIRYLAFRAETLEHLND